MGLINSINSTHGLAGSLQIYSWTRAVNVVANNVSSILGWDGKHAAKGSVGRIHSIPVMLKPPPTVRQRQISPPVRVFQMMVKEALRSLVSRILSCVVKLYLVVFTFNSNVPQSGRLVLLLYAVRYRHLARAPGCKSFVPGIVDRLSAAYMY